MLSCYVKASVAFERFWLRRGFANWTYDNLNRLTASPAGSYTNNTLGDRTIDPAGNHYYWDQLNRMTSFTGSNSITTNYSYRANGMRVLKSDTNNNSTSYAYDGQMGFEDVEVGGSNPGTTDYAIGARGLERLAFNNGSATTVSYPIFDGHGNMTATLSESGSGYSIGDNRCYDPWGNVIGGTGGDPKGRYCANLGHKQDDESGLIYMRARFYDATCGRFISQDPSKGGSNWYEYAGNDPVQNADKDGKAITLASWLFLILAIEMIVLGHVYDAGPALDATALAIAILAFAKDASDKTGGEKAIEEAIGKPLALDIEVEVQVLDSPEGIAAQDSLAGSAVDEAASETGEIIGELASDELDDEDYYGNYGNPSYGDY